MAYQVADFLSARGHRWAHWFDSLVPAYPVCFCLWVMHEVFAAESADERMFDSLICSKNY